MSDTSFSHFLGDKDHRFHLTPKLIPELESVTGAGIGSLFKRLTDGQYRFADIGHTVRLGLIGGGMAPKDAARLCATYVEDRPLRETYPIALAILERLWFGAPVVDAAVKEIESANAAS